jgi:hypothetical protein
MNKMNAEDVSKANVNYAVAQIRALRMLPQTKGTEAAVKRVLNRLNLKDTTEVALRLAVLEEQDKKAVITSTTQTEVSNG